MEGSDSQSETGTSARTTIYATTLKDKKKKKRCTEKLSSELIYSLTLSLPETTYLLTSVHFGRLTILPRHPLYVFTVFINILIIANDSIYPFIDSYSCCIKPLPPLYPFCFIDFPPHLSLFRFPPPPIFKERSIVSKETDLLREEGKKKMKKKKDGKFRGVSYSLLSSWGVPQHFLKFSHSIPLFRICRPRRVGTARRKKRSRSPTIDGERGRERRNGNKKKRG